MTPTARSLAECRRRGWVAQVVERWNPHARVRNDLFGVLDIVALIPPELTPQGEILGSTQLIGIQACAGSSHAARIAKVRAEPRLKLWLDTGARAEVWSWSKRGKRSERKLWRLREEAVLP